MTDEGQPVPNAEEPVTPSSLLRRYLTTALVVVLLGGVIASVLVRTGGTHDGKSSGAAAAAPRRDVPPLRLETVPTSLAAHYTFARDHMSEYAQIPCWCGCQQFLAHRNLYDCYVRPDGKGWEAHAAGCGVCQAEAVMAEQMLGAGKSAADVKVAVTQRFGTTAITDPSAAQ